MATHSSTPAWRIPWTEEAKEAAVCGVTKSDTMEVTQYIHRETKKGGNRKLIY